MAHAKKTKFDWQLSEKGIGISFLRISPGKEVDFQIRTNKLNAESANEKRAQYKCIGSYDIVEIFEITNLNEEFIYKTDPDLLDIVSIPCFSWSNTDYSKKFFDWSQNTTLVFLILLKIEDKIFDKFESGGERQVIESVREISENLSIHIGIGYNEIIAFYKTNDLDSVYDLISKIRLLRIDDIPAFGDTVTFPLVSYDNVINNRKYSDIKGDLRIVTKVSCHPCVEQEIYNELTGSGHRIDVYDLFGENDIIIEWPSDMPAGNIIENLMNFRKKWSGKAGLYNTCTLLQKAKKTKLPVKDRTSTSPFKQIIQIDLKDIQTLQRKLGHNNFEKFFVLNYIQDYLTKWNGVFSCPNYSSAFHDMLCFNYVLEARFREYKDLLSQYQELSTSENKKMDDELFRIKEKIASLEGYIVQLIDYANLGFGQRYVGLETSSSMGTSLLSAMFGGLNRVVHAAAAIPDYLYASYDNDNPWLGYVFFKQIYGYQIFSEGEVISIPESAILYPLFPGITWMTMTHEVAHGLYFRLGLNKNRAFLSCLKKMENTVEKDLKRQNLTEVAESKIEDLDIYNDVWELFASWFDFRFVYESDRDFYLWCIWSSWSKVPRVYNDLNTYLFRSVLIYVINDYNKFVIELKKGQGRQYLSNALDYIVQFLEEQDILGFSIPNLSNVEKDWIINKTNLFAYMIDFLEITLRPKLIFPQKIDKNLKKHVNKILKGEVIFDEIKNPVLLFQELLKAVKTMPSLETDMRINISLIYSLSNTTHIYQKKKINRIKTNDQSIRQAIEKIIKEKT